MKQHTILYWPKWFAFLYKKKNNKLSSVLIVVSKKFSIVKYWLILWIPLHFATVMMLYTENETWLNQLCHIHWNLVWLGNFGAVIVDAMLCYLCYWSMGTGFTLFSGIAFNLFTVDRPQPWWPFGSGDCPYVQDWQEQVRDHRKELDSEVCYGLVWAARTVRGGLSVPVALIWWSDVWMVWSVPHISGPIGRVFCPRNAIALNC